MENYQVVVLNADLSFLNVVGWKRALNLLESGKAEIVKSGKKLVKNFDGTFTFVIPAAVRLKKFIKEIFKYQVPFSKRNVKFRDDHSCQYCGSKSGKMTIDHIVPISRGGKDSWENCVTSCHSCNSLKGNLMIHETNMSLRAKPYAPSGFQFLSKKVKSNGIDIDLNGLDWGFTA